MFFRVLMCCVVCLSLIGCNQINPGTWDQARVETKLKENHGLTEISLVPAEGGFTGTGKTEKGETYTFKVKQDPALKKLSWDFNSDRGDTGSEIYEIVTAK